MRHRLVGAKMRRDGVAMCFSSIGETPAEPASKKAVTSPTALQTLRLTDARQKKSLKNIVLKAVIKSLAATDSLTLLRAVPLAMRGLTSEFGMGSGIPLSLLPPSKTILSLF